MWLLGRMCSGVWFPCWPHTWESSTCVACPACPGGVPARAGWAEPPCPCSTALVEWGEECCWWAPRQVGLFGGLPEQRCEAAQGVGEPRNMSAPPSCEWLPGARPHLDDAQPGPSLPRSPTGAEWRPRVREHRDPHRVWGSLQRAGVALPVMGQGDRTPVGLGIQLALAAEAALGCLSL